MGASATRWGYSQHVSILTLWKVPTQVRTPCSQLLCLLLTIVKCLPKYAASISLFALRSHFSFALACLLFPSLVSVHLFVCFKLFILKWFPMYRKVIRTVQKAHILFTGIPQLTFYHISIPSSLSLSLQLDKGLLLSKPNMWVMYIWEHQSVLGH